MTRAKLRITANPAAIAKLRNWFVKYFDVEEVPTTDRYGRIELLGYRGGKLVPIVVSPVYVTDDPRTVKDTVDMFWIKEKQLLHPDYNPVRQKYFEKNPRDPYER